MRRSLNTPLKCDIMQGPFKDATCAAILNEEVEGIVGLTLLKMTTRFFA